MRVLVLVLVPMAMRMSMAVPQVAMRMFVRVGVLVFMGVSMPVHMFMLKSLLPVLGRVPVFMPVTQSLAVRHW
jgi:hypothetical protein